MYEQHVVKHPAVEPCKVVISCCDVLSLMMASNCRKSSFDIDDIPSTCTNFGSVPYTEWGHTQCYMNDICQEDLVLFCTKVVGFVLHVPVHDIVWGHMMFVDSIANEILAFQGRKDLDTLKPVETTPDRNCLCHAVSLAVFGSEEFHVTIWSLIVIELIGNQHLYLNKILLSVGCCHICQPMGELFTQYSEVYNGHSVLSEMRIKQVLIHEVQRFLGDGVWGGLWQLAAVANVIE